MRGTGAERPVVASNGRNGPGAKGSCHPVLRQQVNLDSSREEPMAEDKPFCISKWAVLSAGAKVRDNRGAAGVDGVSVEGFEKKLKNNLYRIWNRMSSGSYMPPPVRRVMIPKADGRQPVESLSLGTHDGPCFERNGRPGSYRRFQRGRYQVPVPAIADGNSSADIRPERSADLRSERPVIIDVRCASTATAGTGCRRRAAPARACRF